MAKTPPTIRLLLLLLLCGLLQGAALAQDGVDAQPARPATSVADGTVASTPPAAAGDDAAAAAAADAAVSAWLARTPISITQLSSMDPEAICEALPGLVVNPPPEPGTKVNLDDRQPQDASSPDERVFTYSAVRPGDRLDVVEATMQRQEDGSWSAAKVGYLGSMQPQGVRLWLQTPTASLFFVVFTLLVLYGLIRPTRLRGWLREGAANLREHRRLVIGTMVLLYGMFGLGALVGSGLPQSCEQAVLDVVNTAVTSLGATDAYGSGNIMRAAVTTFYQNFGVVTLSVTFTLALLFGIPAYLLSMVSYFVQGIPFGLLGGGSVAQFVMVLVLLLVELTSYFLVVAGGGMLLVTLVKQGFSALPRAFRKLVLTLPFAMVLLLFGAWYEAIIVTWLGG